MGQMMRFQEILRRLAIIDEGFVEDQAGLALGMDRPSALDAKTAALLQLAAAVATGRPGVCLEWGTTRALAAGASEDEIADVLLAIAPVTGLARIACAAPDLATALGYDIATALRFCWQRPPLPGRSWHSRSRPGSRPALCRRAAH